MMKKLISMISISLVLLLLTLGCGVKGTAPETDMEMGVSGLVALADSHIGSCVGLMEVLAETQEVQSGNWEVMEAVLTEADQVQQLGPKWFALPDGSYYMVGRGKVDKNIADRAYFAKLMSGDKTLGDLVISKSTGEKVLVATVPVIKEGKVIGGLGTSIFLNDLSNIIAEEMNLSDEMVFCAVTPGNEVALHTNTDLILQENVELPSKAVYKTSPLTGWRFALGYKD
jgi:hypothetical protein